MWVAKRTTQQEVREFIKCESWQTSWAHAKRKNNWSNQSFQFLVNLSERSHLFSFLFFGFWLHSLAMKGFFHILYIQFNCWQNLCALALISRALFVVCSNKLFQHCRFVLQTEMKIVQTMVQIHRVLSHSKQLDGCLNWVQQQRKTLTLFTTSFLGGMRYVALCNQQTIFPSLNKLFSKRSSSNTHR